MTEKQKRLTGILSAAALLLLGLLQLLRGAGDAASLKGIRSEEERLAFLAAQGWEADAASVMEQRVTLPREFPPVLADYNRLQLRQGFDLTRYAGKRITVYTYRVLNYPDAGEVWCCLYQRRGRIIGGDVHSAALGGFMIELLPSKNG